MNLRNETINRLWLGEDTKIPILEKKRHTITLNDLAKRYFDNKRVEKPGRSTEDRASKYDKHYSQGLGTHNLSFITEKL